MLSKIVRFFTSNWRIYENDARASRSPAVSDPASGLASLIYREQSHYHITNIMRSNLRMNLKRSLDSFVVQNLWILLTLSYESLRSRPVAGILYKHCFTIVLQGIYTELTIYWNIGRHSVCTAAYFSDVYKIRITKVNRRLLILNKRIAAFL